MGEEGGGAIAVRRKLKIVNCEACLNWKTARRVILTCDISVFHLIYHVEEYTNLCYIFIHIKGGLHDSDYT